MTETGLRLEPRAQGLSERHRAAFAGLPVAALSDCMGRCTGTRYLMPRHGDTPLVGNAVTVRTRAGDNLMIHKAFDLLQAGDVLVVDAGGACDNAVVGDLMMQMAQRRGVAGFVIDGAVRDVAAFRKAGFPCYSRGVTHRGPHKDGLGEINTVVTIDGMVVFPGDLIVADADGVLAIRPDDAPDLLERAVRHVEREKAFSEAVANDAVDRGWVDARIAALRGAGR
ncbi:RraA family protein [Paraburkholderia phenoliruptrix]|uniref:RraA family protein n=1 Tax=Paraburkholderia phenoliruptrix TaxID=252970 RepID=UPI0028698A72|nr:RraA family protein [Paraburkholderia phenoliruptrix]WMY07556.1 RraA family protein [Paraburkholderia phenoliruptrix]